jgi:hypothetical protein
VTNERLAEFIGITDLTPDMQSKFIDGLSPERRALFERMAELEGEIMLWQAGVGKKPQGVILCGKKEIRGAR